MPIYEYSCRDCGARFEKLLRRAEDAAELACPTCGQRDLAQELSVFAAHAASSPAPRMPMEPCAGCQNPGACGFKE
jgi:putative FmdB family regulatory protein